MGRKLVIIGIALLAVLIIVSSYFLIFQKDLVGGIFNLKQEEIRGNVYDLYGKVLPIEKATEVFDIGYGFTGMKIKEFKVDGKSITNLNYKEDEYELKTEFRGKPYSSVKQDIYLKNKELINKDFNYSLVIEIDYSEVRWKGKKYVLTEVPVTFGSWMEKDKITGENILTTTEIFMDDIYHKRIIYQDIAEKGGYAIAYKKDGKYYIELKIDNLNIKAGENYYIDPVFYNDTDGFFPEDITGIAPDGRNIDSNGTDFWYICDDDNFYHIGLAGDGTTRTNLSYCVLPAGVEGFGISRAESDGSFWQVDYNGPERAHHFSSTCVNITDGFNTGTLTGVVNPISISVNNSGGANDDLHIVSYTSTIVNHVKAGVNQSDGFDAEPITGQITDNYGLYMNGTDFWVLATNPEWFLYHIDENKNNVSDGFNLSELIGLTGSNIMEGGITGNVSDIWIMGKNTKFIYHLNPNETALGTPEVTLNNPIANYNTTNKTITFNCSVEVSGGFNLTNISLYHNASGVWTLNQTNITLEDSNSTTVLFDTTFDYGTVEWSCYACANNSECVVGGNRTFSVKKLIVNSQTYNSTTWETDTEDFIINVSGSGLALTANLWYNRTSYAGTKIGTDYDALFIRTLNIPIGVANKSFYWEISYDGTPYINFTEQNQTINTTLLDLCNATLTIPYINFTFIDEENVTVTNGSIDITTWDYYLGSGDYNKTLTFTNVTANPSYGFCLNPDVAHKTLHHNVVVQYYGTGYPQRRWTYNTDLTNLTLNQTLYLLGSADGIYSIYQVQESTGSSIPGVTVQTERQFAGIWTLVEQGTTDGAGAVTFWLNPDYDHRLTFTKLGYTSVQETLRPSSSTYTVVMTTSEVGNATYNSSIEGMSWTIRPNPGMLNPNTNYTFEFNVTSLIHSLTACKMELLDENNTVLSTTTGCTATGGNLSVSFNTTTQPNLRGKYSLNIGEGYFVIDADAFWGIIDMDFPERGTIKAFFEHLRDLDEFGDDEGRAEFSRIILFFLILVVVLGIMCKTTGWDFSTAGGAILLLFPIILIASVSGFFTLSYMPWAGDALLETWMQKYTVALISFFISGGYLCHKIADSMK